MSAEPPPTDWVTNDACFHDHRSILNGEAARQTQSISRVVLEAAPRSQPAPSITLPQVTPRTARRWWEDVAYSTWRRGQLLALLGFIAVVILTAYGWQQGTLLGIAAEIASDRTGAGGAPASPQMSSDHVAATEFGSAADGDGRRSTASFASDRSITGTGDEPSAGAKLFVADGKKSSKGSATSASNESTAAPDLTPTDGNGADGGRTPDGTGNSGARRSTRTQPSDGTAPSVRYESCTEASAAGAAPIRLGEPGYRLSLDGDKDGVACENGSRPEDPGDAPVDSLNTTPPTSTTSVETTSSPESTVTSATSTTTVSSTTTTATSVTSTSSTVATTATTTRSSTTISTTAATSASTIATTSSPTTTTTSTTIKSTTTGPTTTAATTTPTSTTAPTITVPSTSSSTEPSTDPEPNRAGGGSGNGPV